MPALGKDVASHQSLKRPAWPHLMVVGMFDETNLKRFAAELGRLAGYPANLVERDVWQKLVLRGLYASEGLQGRLAFKGGTCITRTLLGYYRFSEDLDFGWDARKPRTFYAGFSSRYLSPLSALGASAGRHYGTLGGRLMKWDLLCGSTKLVISVDFSQGPAFPAEMREVSSIKVPLGGAKRLSALHPGIFSAYYSRLAVPCHSPKEIACEKLAAILTRRELTKPRDLVDIMQLSGIVDLRALAGEKRCAEKVGRMVMCAPAYAAAFRERRGNLPAYLARLADEAANEGEIYLIKPGRAKLRRFASGTLAPILERLAGGIMPGE